MGFASGEVPEHRSNATCRPSTPRNLIRRPHDIHATLRRRAAAEGESLHEYLLARLSDEATTPTLDEALDRAPHGPLLSRCWELRGNLSVHDAAYVASAEATDAPLLTADSRLAAPPGPRCTCELLT